MDNESPSNSEPIVVTFNLFVWIGWVLFSIHKHQKDLDSDFFPIPRPISSRIEKIKKRGSIMKKINIFAEKRVSHYFKIYEQIYENPYITICKIRDNVPVVRNTVSDYVTYMYQYEILRGPYLFIAPAQDYTEYVYLLNFENPHKIAKGLKELSPVVSTGVTFGTWNTLVIANTLLNFRTIAGFKNVYFSGEKGIVTTPKVVHRTWRNSFEAIDEKMNQSKETFSKEIQVHPLPWGPDEWNLFHAFKDNIRKKTTLTLKEIGVRYKIFMTWRKSLENHCTIHTEFYPEGYNRYMHYLFLFSTDYKAFVTSLFSLFPTTSTIMPVGDHLLVKVNIYAVDMVYRLFETIQELENKRIIKEYSCAFLLFEY